MILCVVSGILNAAPYRSDNIRRFGRTYRLNLNTTKKPAEFAAFLLGFLLGPELGGMFLQTSGVL
jgi:hypothetical protein